MDDVSTIVQYGVAIMHAEHTDRGENLKDPGAISDRKAERTEYRSVEERGDHRSGIEEV